MTWAEEVLEAHNDKRRLHCSPPLKWDGQLAAYALQEAERLAKLPATSPADGFIAGEPDADLNVFVSSGSQQKPAHKLMHHWYDEQLPYYNWDSPGPSVMSSPGVTTPGSVRDFVNVIWKATTKVGVAHSNDLKVYVAVYETTDTTAKAPGDYEKNVLRKSYTCQDDSGSKPKTDDSDAPEKWKQEVVNEHNRKRALHCSPKLVWSQELYESAKKAADAMQASGVLFHNNTSGASGQYGQNIFEHSSTTSLVGPIVSWYDEVDKYDFNSPGLKDEAGHFTQLVWKDTKRVGMAASSNGKYVVANYYPAGNVNSRKAFEENVLPMGCNKKDPKDYDDYKPSPKKRKTSSGCGPCAGYIG